MEYPNYSNLSNSRMGGGGVQRSYHYIFKALLLGAVHKRRSHKIAKNDPHCPQNVLTGSPPPSCPCGHTIKFEKSYAFCTRKYGRPHLKNPGPLVRKMFALDKLLPPDCRRLLWTTPYVLCWIMYGMLSWSGRFNLGVFF